MTTTSDITKQQALTPEMFRPAVVQDEAEKISRPIITYWKDAMLRLRRNRVAMVCIFTIMFITAVGVIGPFFFPNVGSVSYENSQSPDVINQPPTLGEKMLVTDDAFEFPADDFDASYDATAPVATTVEAIQTPSKIEIIGRPNVNGVTLAWNTVPNVSGYQIYRSVINQGAATDMSILSSTPELRGVLVGTVSDPSQRNYTDSSGLDAYETYVYSVLPFVTTPEGEELHAAISASVETKVEKIIRFSDAVNIEKNAQIGDTIKGRAYLFGTDSLGRDVFARTVQGTRVDLFLALVIPSIAVLIGLIYGSISGLSGGYVDLVMMRIIEILDALPELLLLVLLQVAMGKGMQSLIISLSAFSWLRTARLVRAEVLRLREIEFVQAAVLLGAPPTRIVFKHLAPNLLGILIIVWSALIPGVIAGEAFLSLIGLGLEQPAASWGTVLQDAAVRFQTNPFQFFMPAAVLATALLAFYLLGDALRDAFDPKLRGRE